MFQRILHRVFTLIAGIILLTANKNDDNFALGFAASSGKKGGKVKRQKASSSTKKGFGAPPPTLEEIVSSFKTRIPVNDGGDAESLPCPCGTGKSYGDCCGPLHRNERKCLTMMDVLRSRYSAFSWRNIGYVMKTTHEVCGDYREDRIAWAKDLNKGGMFDSFEFVKLEAGPEELSDDDENEGFVEFKVTLRAREASESLTGSTAVTERSRFLRNVSDGSWSYASGDVQSDVAGLENTKLNV